MKWFLILFLGCVALSAKSAFAQESPGPVPQEAIDAAIDRGMEYLVQDQDIDGSWRFDSPTHRGGITGLCVYTLLKGGFSKHHQSVQRGLRFLDVCEATTTYEAACMVLAYSEADGEHYRARLQQLTDQLIEWNEGTWAYPTSIKDISNTHFGSLALHHSRKLGLKISERIWKRIGREMEQWQKDDGGFPYRKGERVTYSMTAAGLGVACMNREAARQLGTSQRRLVEDMDEVIARGLEWFDAHYNLHERPWPGNVDGRRWDYYFLYALQRVGMLAPATTMAGHDWYQDGARWLLKKQEGPGCWSTDYGEKQSNSCLAILFLLRASGPSTGSKVPGKRVYRTADADAEVILVVTGDAPMRVWIESFDGWIKETYEWPGEEGQGLRVARVQYWVGDKKLAEVEGKSAIPSGNERFAATLLFDGPGPREVVAVIEIVPPSGSDQETVELRSEPLPIEVTSGLLPWMREAIEDHSRNLLRQTRVRCSASSSLSDHWGEQRAADGLMGRGWACAESDTEPTITLDLDDAVRGNVLLFTHARETGHDPNAFARARALEVQINKAKWVRVEMDPDETHKTRMVLDRMQKVRRISVRLLDMQPGAKHAKAGGLMEIEFQAVKDPR